MAWSMTDIPEGFKAAGKFVEADLGYSTPCWLWTDQVLETGYAQRKIDGKMLLLHRAFYTQIVGPIPDGAQLDHLCHSSMNECIGGWRCLHRRCINPLHLEPVSGAENSHRSSKAGLTIEKVKEIREKRERVDDLAARFGIHKRTVYRILSRETWADV